MELVDLKAEVREQRGKGAARQLRRKGFIPSVLYGPKTKTVSLSLESEEVRNILKKAAGANVLINLRIEGMSHILKSPIFSFFARHGDEETVYTVDNFDIPYDKTVVKGNRNVCLDLLFEYRGKPSLP